MDIVYFDINACVLCLLILFTLILHRGIRLEQNRIYIYLLIDILIAAVASLSMSFGENWRTMGNPGFLSKQEVMYISTFVYMLFHVTCPALFYQYVRVVLNIESSRLSDAILSYAPLIAAYTFLVLTPMNDAIFFISGGLYYRGKYMWVFYLVAAWYMLVSMNYVMLYRTNIRASVCISLLSFVVFAGVGVVLQFTDSSFNVESFFNSVVMLVLYITIERPGDYIDRPSGLQNDYAFYVNTSIRIRRRRSVRMVAVSLDNIEFLDNSIGYETTSILLARAAEFFEKISKQTVAYRLDRDLFVLLIKEGAHLTHLELMDIIRQRFAVPFFTDTYSITLFDSSMYISWPDDVKDTEELKRLLTIFTDKNRHRMRHVVQASSIDLDLDKRRRSIDLLLHGAIQSESFNFKYQPIRSTSTGKFDAVELKPMLESEEFGMIAPSEYYPIAEDNGTAVPIIKHIFRVCFEFIKESGITGQEIGEYAIPVPNAFLLMRSAAAWVLETALEHGVDPQYVTIEISENTMIDYNYALEENIRALHEAGFSFMLMDYGNGYTDAEMMLKMHLKEVALNRDLLASAPVSGKADTLIRCAIDMMKSLAIGIKASGVDTPDLEKYALEIGADKIQGFALSRFLSGADLIKFVREKEGRS